MPKITSTVSERIGWWPCPRTWRDLVPSLACQSIGFTVMRFVVPGRLRGRPAVKRMKKETRAEFN